MSSSFGMAKESLVARTLPCKSSFILLVTWVLKVLQTS
jgi:hypothetical protein